MQLPRWPHGLATRWLECVVVLGLILAVAGCGKTKDTLEADIVAAAAANPNNTPQWSPVIRELAHRYVAILKTRRPDAESGRLADKAIADGCVDPFVRYCAFQRYYRIVDVADEKHAKEGLAILHELQAGGYPSVLRAYAAQRAHDVWIMAYGRQKELALANFPAQWDPKLGIHVT